jgi:hypothetical protein
MRRPLGIVTAVVCVWVVMAGWAKAEAVSYTAMPIVMDPAPGVKPDKGPIAAVSFGYFYLGAQSATGAWSWHQQGFYGIPQVNVTPWLGFIGDFVSATNTGANQHEKIEAFLGGPIVTAWSKKKVSPFVFATGGKTRDSKAGTVTSLPALAAGGGFQFKLNKHLGLLFVPGEYVRSFSATGMDQNAFTSRFGVVIPITK